MKMKEIKVKVKDLCKNYLDDGEGGVFAYDGKLCVRPAYQREFCYGDKQRDLVIDSVLNGFPLNVMYWAKTNDGSFEVLDGQQRTISIAQYFNRDFPIKVDGNDKFYHNLTECEKKKIDEYEVTIYICEGTEEEKLAWFKRINTAGLVLTNQELLNATYTGPWLSDAKRYFSKRCCAASQKADGYLKGNPIRQEILEKVLSWIADRDGLESGQAYMALHQHDDDANDIWVYFQKVIDWARMLFPNARKGLTDVQEWGLLYNKYHSVDYNVNNLEADIKKLLVDDDVTKTSGIIPYVLSDRSSHYERLLSIRAFTESQKRRCYEKQEHKCLCCGNEFEFDEMEGDHIVSWSRGGRTVDENLQMLCVTCNRDKPVL